MKTKEEFHNLIDSIQDEEVLKFCLELMKTIQRTKEEGIDPALHADIMKSYEESFEEAELVDHELVKTQLLSLH